MIRRLESLSNLTIVGMSVILPGGEDIHEFGRHIYRGLPMTGQFTDGYPFERAATNAIREVCEEARVAIAQVRIISMSPSITRIIVDKFNNSRVQEVLGVIPALSAASDLLESTSEDAVVLIDSLEDPSMVSAILLAPLKSALDNARPIHAFINGAATENDPVNAAAISGVIGEARRVSGIETEVVGIILTATLQDGKISSEEAQGLLEAGGNREKLTCALTNSLPGLAGIVKTAWCLSRRVIPCAPGWEGPAELEAWKVSPFYTETESRAWFTQRQQKRSAGLNIIGSNDGFSHILFSENPGLFFKNIEAPKREALHLFPVAITSVEELPGKLAVLKTIIQSSSTEF